MNKIKIFITYYFLLFFLQSCLAKDKIIISADSLTFIGRFGFMGETVTFGYPGSTIKFQYRGESIHFGLQDFDRSNPEEGNWFNVIVDGIIVDSLEVDTLQRWYSIDFDFSSSFHEVEIFKRTESMVGNCRFFGIQYQSGDFRKVHESERKIEWIGDSFTTGYGNLISIEAPPKGNPSTGFHSRNENYYYSYSSVVSRSLKARNECVSVSGIGVYRNYDGESSFVMHDAYSVVFPSPSFKMENWDSKTFVDLVVINIGRNDFGREQRSGVLNTDSARFVNGYSDLLNKVHDKQPSAKILLVYGGGLSDFLPRGNFKLSRYRKWMNSVLVEFSKHSTSTCELLEIPILKGPYGEDWHPTIKSHQLMANILESKIKTMMSWH